MKPSVTVDERGVLLHVTNGAGEGIAVPINAELVGDVTKAAARLLTPEGKSAALRVVGRVLLELLKEDDGKKV